MARERHHLFLHLAVRSNCPVPLRAWLGSSRIAKVPLLTWGDTREGNPNLRQVSFVPMKPWICKPTRTTGPPPLSPQPPAEPSVPRRGRLHFQWGGSKHLRKMDHQFKTQFHLKMHPPSKSHSSEEGVLLI